MKSFRLLKKCATLNAGDVVYESSNKTPSDERRATEHTFMLGEPCGVFYTDINRILPSIALPISYLKEVPASPIVKLIYKLADAVSNNEGIELSRDECAQIVDLYERHVQYLETRKDAISNEIDNLGEMYKMTADDLNKLKNDEEQEAKTI